MLDNFDLKPAKVNEVIEVFSEFSGLNDKEFSNSELFDAARNFIEIANGKITKEKIREGARTPTYYSRDTYSIMTKSPWKNLYEYHEQNQLLDHCCLEWNEPYELFEQINQGWE